MNTYTSTNKSKWRRRPIAINPNEFNILMSYQGALTGSLTHKPITTPFISDADNRIVYGITGEEDSITWTLDVPEAGCYLVAIHYTGKMYISAQSQFLGSSRDYHKEKYGIGDRTYDPECRVEVSSNNGKLDGDLRRLTRYNEPDRVAGSRQWLEGLLPLKKGESRITLRFPEISDHQVLAARREIELGPLSKSTVSLGIKSIELIRPEIWSGMKQRSMKMKSDTKWLVEGKYGLFIHWSLRSFPLFGNERAIKNFEWGVNLFDVEAFADAVQETGASWVTFTTCHGAHYFPAPIRTLDDMLSGRTSSRDLIGEIADALSKRNIGFLLYYNFCVNDEPFAKVAGMQYAEDTGTWFQFLIEFATEVSQRYGKQIRGWGYIDNTVTAYEYGMPWEPYVMALKAGHTNALVAISDHWWAPMTPFNELQTADSGANIINPLCPGAYTDDARYADLQPHFSFTLEGSWIPAEPFDGRIRSRKSIPGGPVYGERKYIEYFQRMAKAEVPLTVNMLITQDVTSEKTFFNPNSVELMKKIRQAVW